MDQVEVDLDIALEKYQGKTVPSVDTIKKWMDATLGAIDYQKPVQISIRVVDKQEITELNHRYRHINKATNILSFPYEALPGVDISLLGDLVICAEVVAEEARQQSKSEPQHWAHMIVHGTLHLLGYDHVESADADIMETLEINIMSKLGYPNPYGDINKT